MISRPTTDQLLLECRRELVEVVLPDVQSEHVRVAVQMIDNILANAATRAAHEIAWMREEVDALESFARDVLATTTDGATVSAALDDLLAAPRTSNHLADVTETYRRAGEAFSCALETAMQDGSTELVARAAGLLAARNARELEINGDWAFVGR